MKTEDFERLKAICEKEGFELRGEHPLTGFVGVDYSTWSGNIFFGFHFKDKESIDKSVIGKFLAEQLEKYLNNEL